MKSLRIDRRVGFSLGALTMLFGTLAPAIVPAFASAAEVTVRSIQPSSSATHAGGVQYTTTFTPATAGSSTYGGGSGVTNVYVTLLFCDNSPIAGATCTAPTNMDMSSATVDASDTTATEVARGANYFVVSVPIADVTTSSALSIIVDGITNTSENTAYGRIETFPTSADSTGAEVGTVTTGLTDNGSAAMAFTSAIGVDAAVLESLSFCTFGDVANDTNASSGSDALSFPAATTGTTPTAPSAGCNTQGTPASVSTNGASINLGENIGGSAANRALSTTTPSYGLDWAQLSTNANKGAIVYLKTNNKCAGLGVITPGLSYDSSTTCGIAAPASGGALSTGNAGFGVNVLPAVSAAGDSNADGTVTVNSNYAGTEASQVVTPKFFMGNASAPAYSDTLNGTGLNQDTTSNYGGYLFGSSGAPINDKNVPVEFGGSISNQTPAGLYQATLNLIAVGTF